MSLRDSTKRCLQKFIGPAKFSGRVTYMAVVKVEFIFNSKLTFFLVTWRNCCWKTSCQFAFYWAELDDEDFTI